MKIAGWQKLSLTHYEGKSAAVLYTLGCNFRCYYCYNRPFYVERSLGETLPVEAILAYLKSRRDKLDGVVLTGGEPLTQPGLEDFLYTVKSMGYEVKIETNGSCPQRLAKLLRAQLVDYLSLDLKAPASKLRHVIGVALPPSVIEESKELTRREAKDYEFHTVALPELVEADFLEIAESIRGSKRYVLEQYQKPEGVFSNRSSLISKKPHSDLFLYQLQHQLRDWFDEIIVKGAERHRKESTDGDDFWEARTAVAI